MYFSVNKFTLKKYRFEIILFKCLQFMTNSEQFKYLYQRVLSHFPKKNSQNCSRKTSSRKLFKKFLFSRVNHTVQSLDIKFFCRATHTGLTKNFVCGSTCWMLVKTPTGCNIFSMLLLTTYFK